MEDKSSLFANALSNIIEDSTDILSTLQYIHTGSFENYQDKLETHSQAESISIFAHYGGGRSNNPKLIAEHDVGLTTYGVLSSSYKNDEENSIFHMVDWYRVVLDEAHTIKSWKSQVHGLLLLCPHIVDGV
ncbi:P-loop containing nucleoside triphosphate hydrolase [Parasponia andersonii]|uniref:P-loop containing nucleoside triphosphate hydrolase n=1 Tax=Parasponia andersonii TaxID=3476 RepID=A0A2P5A9X0_PARAD|nr:P-loop containing nucleoside triphosphate hydrolase [Parasponia andersonii]